MIVFINGSINAGKSTIAKLLTERIENTANVEIDNIGAFINRMDIDDAVPINLENAALIIKNLVKRNFNVVVPYPLSQGDYNYMIGELNEYKNKIHVITLSPDIKKAQSSTDNRKIDEREYKRIQHHYDIGIPKPSFGKTIDNTNQTPIETVEEIIKFLS